MARRTTTEGSLPLLVREVALRYPEVEPGVACAGTALESTTFKARKKAFLFLTGAGPTYQLRLKLRESQAEAAELAGQEPGRYKLGANGWATLHLGPGEPLPHALLARWIDESYRAVADKKLLEQLGKRTDPSQKDRAEAREGR